MRKHFLFAAIAAPVLLASCQKEFVVDPNSGGEGIHEIAVRTVSGSSLATRSAVSGTTFPAGYDMVVSAYKNNDAAIAPDDASKNYFEGIKFTKGEAVWHAATPKYWPLTGTLDLLAIAGSGLNTAANGIVPTFVWNTDNVAGSVVATIPDNSAKFDDILFGGSNAQTYMASGNPIVFRHAESAVVFTASSNVAYNAETNVGVTIDSISVNGAKYSGTLTVTNPAAGMSEAKDSVVAAWSDLGSEKAYVKARVWNTANTGVDAAESVLTGLNLTATSASLATKPFGEGYVILPEQDAVPFTVTYTIHNGKDASGSAVNNQMQYKYTPEAGSKWEQGKKHVYDIIINLSEVTIAPTVVDWDSTDTEFFMQECSVTFDANNDFYGEERENYPNIVVSLPIATCPEPITDITHPQKISKPEDPTLKHVSCEEEWSYGCWDENFVFEGWYKEPECINPWDFDNDVVTNNITLYARWIYPIQVYLNDYLDESYLKIIAIKPQGDSLLIPRPEDPVREGFTFIGWYPYFSFYDGRNYIQNYCTFGSQKWDFENNFFYCDEYGYYPSEITFVSIWQPNNILPGEFTYYQYDSGYGNREYDRCYFSKSNLKVERTSPASEDWTWGYFNHQYDYQVFPDNKTSVDDTMISLFTCGYDDFSLDPTTKEYGLSSRLLWPQSNTAIDNFNFTNYLYLLGMKITNVKIHKKNEEVEPYMYQYGVDPNNTIRQGKHKFNVIINGTMGLVLAPDDFKGDINVIVKDTYTADEWIEAENTYGFAFLPAAGYRDGDTIVDANVAGYYRCGKQLFCFDANGVIPVMNNVTNYDIGYSIRPIWQKIEYYYY